MTPNGETSDYYEIEPRRSSLSNSISVRLFSAAAWFALGLVGALIEGPFRGDNLWTLTALSTVTAIMGLWGFIHSGGPRITAAGMFMISIAVFIGYAGLWWCNFLGRDVPSEMVLIVGSAYAATLVSYHLFWWPDENRVPKSSNSFNSSNSTKWTSFAGLGIVAVSLTAHILGGQSVQVLSEAGTVLGILLFSYGASNYSTRFRIFSSSSVVLIILMVLFVAIVFDGFGRLPVIALAGSVGVLLTQWSGNRAIKYLAIAAVPASSTLLTALRYWRLDGVSPSLPSEATGPDSDVGGLWTYSRLVELGDRLEFGWGETFASTLVAWIPREIWNEKPFGLGFDLTLLLEPQLAPYGHSLVATVFGEWYFNFGWWGIPAFVLMVGPAIRWLDRRQLDDIDNPSQRSFDVMKSVLMAAAIGAIPHLVWSGTHTFFARLMALGGLWIILWFFVWVVSRRTQSDGRAARV